MSTKASSSVHPLLEVKDLSFSRKRKESDQLILNNINLSLDRHSSLAVLGPSGCGKTTLLHLVAGLIPSYKGQIHFLGQPIHRPHKKMSIIFQDYGLFPWKKVWDNIFLGLKVQKKTDASDINRAKETLKQLGISHLENRYLTELSEGQRQRLAIARSLILEPDLLILDEPFSSLDALTKHQLQNILFEKWKEGKFALLIVTHCIEEAAFLGERIIILNSTPQKEIEVVDNPLTLGVHWPEELSSFCQKIRDKLNVPTS